MATARFGEIGSQDTIDLTVVRHKDGSATTRAIQYRVSGSKHFQTPMSGSHSRSSMAPIVERY